MILDVCERSIENYYVEAKKKNLDLFFTFQPDLPREFEGDPLRISQILNNIISNAIKYSEKGFIQLDVTLIEKFGKNMIKFLVKDQGIGISQEFLAKIFTPFQQFGENGKKGWVNFL